MCWASTELAQIPPWTYYWLPRLLHTWPLTCFYLLLSNPLNYVQIAMLTGQCAQLAPLYLRSSLLSWHAWHTCRAMISHTLWCASHLCLPVTTMSYIAICLLFKTVNHYFQTLHLCFKKELLKRNVYNTHQPPLYLYTFNVQNMWYDGCFL